MLQERRKKFEVFSRDQKPRAWHLVYMVMNGQKWPEIILRSSLKASVKYCYDWSNWYWWVYPRLWYTVNQRDHKRPFANSTETRTRLHISIETESQFWKNCSSRFVRLGYQKGVWGRDDADWFQYFFANNDKAITQAVFFLFWSFSSSIKNKRILSLVQDCAFDFVSVRRGSQRKTNFVSSVCPFMCSLYYSHCFDKLTSMWIAKYWGKTNILY